MGHGIVDVFAYQEALLIEAVFGVAILTMIWVGFRRWLQHKEKMGRLFAEQTAQMERVEARLEAVEQTLSDASAPPAPEIAAPRPNPLSEPMPKQTKA